MSGLTFHRSVKYDEVIGFYRDSIGMDTWLEQGGCTILQKGNFLLGFCNREESDVDGMITFFCDSREEIDALYEKFKSIAQCKPKETPQYRIYHFFAKDPEGRNVEFQTFLHNTEPHHEGREMLMNRRSIRFFADESVSSDLLKKVLEPCRYVPTSRNSQAYYFKIIRDQSTLESLGSIRDSASAPISRAKAAIAVYIDKEKTLRPEQDGAIASTYFLLSASQHGLGTCWIGGMDRDDVKEILNLPLDNHIAMISPIGWPAEKKSKPERRELIQFVEGL